MNPFRTTRARLILTMLALLLALGAAPPQRPAQAQLSAPPSGTVIGQQVVSLYGPTALTGSGTTNSASPRTVSGSRDLSDVRYFSNGVLFVNADFATTGTLTATVQFSVDRTNWASATWNYVAGSTLTTATRQVVIIGDGTGYAAIPIDGPLIRVSMVRTASVTPTVNLWLRNNGGS